MSVRLQDYRAVESVRLVCTEGGHNKEYTVSLMQLSEGAAVHYAVRGRYGRIGGRQSEVVKCQSSSRPHAQAMMADLVSEKESRGYRREAPDRVDGLWSGTRALRAGHLGALLGTAIGEDNPWALEQDAAQIQTMIAASALLTAGRAAADSRRARPVPLLTPDPASPPPVEDTRRLNL